MKEIINKLLEYIPKAVYIPFENDEYTWWQDRINKSDIRYIIDKRCLKGLKGMIAPNISKKKKNETKK